MILVPFHRREHSVWDDAESHLSTTKAASWARRRSRGGVAAWRDAKRNRSCPTNGKTSWAARTSMSKRLASEYPASPHRKTVSAVLRLSPELRQRVKTLFAVR